VFGYPKESWRIRSFWRGLERVVQTHIFSIVSELSKADPGLSPLLLILTIDKAP